MKTYSFPARQTGVTLVELMVSIAIGMIIVLFITSLFLTSRQSSRLSDDNSRMQEEGRAVMYIMARNLQQAGFGDVVSTDMSSSTSRGSLTGFSGNALRGCDTGFVNSDLANVNCGAGKAAFQVSYNVPAYNSITGAGADCNGQNAAGVATNRFYLGADKTLYCLGNGNATPQPLLGNVEEMQVTYGVSTVSSVDVWGFRSAEQFTNAAGVKALQIDNQLLGEAQNWDNVISVNICLHLSSPNNNVTNAKQSYTPCGSTTAVTATDKRLHMVVSGVYALRNNGSVRNFPM